MEGRSQRLQLPAADSRAKVTSNNLKYSLQSTQGGHASSPVQAEQTTRKAEEMKQDPVTTKSPPIRRQPLQYNSPSARGSDDTLPEWPLVEVVELPLVIEQLLHVEELLSLAENSGL